jgi:hypothetical protein
MQVAFYLDSDAPEFMALASLAVAAVRRHMPHAQIVHQTTEAGPVLPGADSEIRIAAAGSFAERRARLNAACGPGDTLFLDVDCIVRADVSAVFARPFDIALPVVPDPVVRYTGGVVFSRSPAFWAGWDAANRGVRYPGVREHLLAWQRYVKAWPGLVRELPHQVYERLPLNAADACEGAAIVHYRGPRKKWVGAQWDTATT